MGYTDKELLTINPELDAIFRKYGRPKPFLFTREEMPQFRRIFSTGSARFLKSTFARRALETDSPPTWVEQNVEIGVRDGSRIAVRIYVPEKSSSSEASVTPGAMVFLHGGGWCMGDLDTEAFFCRLICKELGLVIFDVAYRLYPDVNFPVPILDSYDAVKWVALNAGKFGADLRKAFIVGGNSGGATYASIAAHLARDDGLKPPLTGQYLSCPILTDGYGEDSKNLSHLFPSEYRSQEQNWNAPLQDRATQQRIGEMADFDFTSPYLTPFHFKDHQDLPPAYVQVCGLDPWRDGGIIYANLVQQSGSAAHMDIYPGLPHCWWTVYHMLSATEDWRKDSLKGVRWLLEHSSKLSSFSRL